MHIEQVHNICTQQKEVSLNFTERLCGVGMGDRHVSWQGGFSGNSKGPSSPAISGQDGIAGGTWFLKGPHSHYRCSESPSLPPWHCLLRGDGCLHLLSPTSVSHTPKWYISFTTDLRVGSIIRHFTFVDSLPCAKLSDRQASYFISIFTAILEEDITLHFVPRRKWRFGVVEWLWKGPWLGTGKGAIEEKFSVAQRPKARTRLINLRKLQTPGQSWYMCASMHVPTWFASRLPWWNSLWFPDTP